MANNNVADYRARATQARRIAENMHSHEARVELIQMADALDAEAEGLEKSTTSNEMPLPKTGG